MKCFIIIIILFLMAAAKSTRELDSYEDCNKIKILILVCGVATFGSFFTGYFILSGVNDDLKHIKK